MSEGRRVSARVKAIKQEEKPPETPKSEERPKKVRKIYARSKPSDIPSSSKKDGIATPRTADSSSAQASPAPFNKLSKDSPLPTAPVDTHFDVTNLQSIAKSGVLAASVARSRAQWISGGVLERYWTKPKKSKLQIIEPPGNPSKDTMTSALGKIRVTVEPHTIDAVIYGIRDLPAPAAPSTPAVTAPNSAGRPPVNTANPAFSTPQNRPLQTPPITGSQPANPQAAPSNKPIASTANSQTMSPYPAPPAASGPSPIPQQRPGAPASSAQQSSLNAATSNDAQSNSAPSTLPFAGSRSSQPSATAVPQVNAPRPVGQQPPPPQQSQQQRPQQANQDPVIQALARRAQENPNLKALMKIVAAGKAEKDQLAEFQTHIDELTQQIRAQQGANVSQAFKSAAPAAPAPPGPQNLQQYPQASSTSRPPPAPMTAGSARSPLGNPTPYTYQPPPRPQQQARPPAQPEKYRNIAIEFLNPGAACNSTPNDRLLFPKFCMLSRSADKRHLTASFFLVKSSGGKKYRTPISMDIEYLEREAILGVIERSNASTEEVQKHNEEVLRTTEPAPDRGLVLRTPKSTSEAKAEQRASPMVLDPPKRGRKKDEDLTGLCQFCYTPVPDSTSRDEEGRLSCKPCVTLKLKAQMARMSKPIKVQNVAREVKAAECLTWG